MRHPADAVTSVASMDLEEGMSMGAHTVVPVVGATGGAGATTVACGIAIELAARQGRSVLLDLDLECGDTHSLWDVPADRTIRDLHDVRESIRAEHLALVGYAHASGVQVVRSPGIFGSADGWTAKHVAGLISAAHQDAACVIDCGRAPFSCVREACRPSGHLVVVAPSTVRAARRVRLICEAIEDVGITLVVNRGGGAPDVSTRAFSRIAGTDIDGEMPRSASATRRLRAGLGPDRRRLRAALDRIVARVADGC